MAQFSTTIGRHLECAIQTEQMIQTDRHNSIICQKDTKGFMWVGTVPRSKVMQSYKNRKTQDKDI